MTFQVTTDAYGRFMGRFSEPLAERLVALIDPDPGWSALDVGAGGGAVVRALAPRLDAGAVSAADPSPTMVEGLRAAFPDMDVRQAPADALPWSDREFDLVVASLVVHFMPDPPRGVAEMARVAAREGLVAATTWDFVGRRSPLEPFWSAVRESDPGVDDESSEPGARGGELEALLAGAGLVDVAEHEIVVSSDYDGFDEWWYPYTLGVGPAGAYVAALDPLARDRLRDACRARLPVGPFAVTGTAWAALGHVPT